MPKPLVTIAVVLSLFSSTGFALGNADVSARLGATSYPALRAELAKEIEPSDLVSLDQSYNQAAVKLGREPSAADVFSEYGASRPELMQSANVVGPVLLACGIVLVQPTLHSQLQRLNDWIQSKLSIKKCDDDMSQLIDRSQSLL
jgi:hypothetical protein